MNKPWPIADWSVAVTMGFTVEFRFAAVAPIYTRPLSRVYPDIPVSVCRGAVNEYHQLATSQNPNIQMVLLMADVVGLLQQGVGTC